MLALPESLVLCLVAFLAAAAVIAGLYMDRRRFARSYRQLAAANEQAHAVLGAVAPAWLARLPGTAEWLASPRLAAWLDRDARAVPQLLIDAAPEIPRLAETGTPFERTVEVDGRWLRLSGHALPQTGGTLLFVHATEMSTEIQDRQMLLDERQALRRSSDRMERLLNAAPFLVWHRDREDRITWVNDAYVAAVGAPDRDTVLHQQTELTSGSMAGALRQEAQKAQQSTATQTAKHFVVVGDQRRAMRIMTLPLETGEGTVGYAVDVTETEELNAEISRLTEAHKETLNTMNSAVAIFAPDKTLDYFNQPFAQLWQLPEDWLETHPHHGDLLDAMREQRRLPEQVDFRSWKDDRLRLYTDAIEAKEDYWHLPDGRTLRVVTHPHPLGGILQLFEDVTDRLAMERSFNTLIAVQRETLNKLHEGVAVFSGDGLLRLHNPAYARMWHLESAVLDTGPHVTRILDLCAPLFDGEEEAQEMHGVLLGGQEERELRQGRLRRSDGSVVDYTAVPLPDGDTLITFIDVTDRLQIEHALRERNEALEAADRLKSEFVAHVSYELRTPLNNIIGFSEILDAEHFGALNEKQKEYVADIVRSSESLRALINDILDLSMIEAGAMTLETESVPVLPVLEEVVRIAREDIDRKSLTCTIQCPRNVGALECDRQRLLQIVYNLVSNAVKYTPEEGAITVGARRRKDRTEIYVTDTGIGIAPQEQENVFTKFHTGPHGGARGAGLGLSLVRSFVEMHNGHVVLESEPGKGTNVTCVLPRRQDEADTAADNLEKDRQSEPTAASTVH